jgi:hypothetical protein
MPRMLPLIASTLALLTSFSALSSAQTLTWAGYTWNVTYGGMAGVAPGDPANVTIDANGYLRLRIVNRQVERQGQRQEQWTAAQLFTADNLGFGTFQWIVEGDVYRMDPTTVLGLFLYGPANGIGVDGEDEIDIEFSRWDNTCACNADFTVYPSTGHYRQDNPSWEDDFRSRSSDLTTARFEWSSEKIIFTLMKGSHSIGETEDIIQTATYASNRTNIPQTALPVGINLWCFQHTPASDQYAVIRNFQYAPQP